MEQEESIKTLIIEGGPMGQRVEVQKLSLNKIKLGKNSRLSVSNEELDGLMQSIKEVGLLQPIGVAKNGSGYEICYGNRRFMACSKLGFTHIPVIVHENNKDSELDLKNLTENIQRRNIGLAEAGRYLDLLRKSELSVGEMAVRLGVSKSYIQNCLSAYEEVPKEFRNDLEMKVLGHGKTKKTPGKIAIKTAKAILSARKSYRLNPEQIKMLFKKAKENDDFVPENVGKYSIAIKEGKQDFMKAVPKLKYITCRIAITQDEAERLNEKYIVNGPFRSISALCAAILDGSKAEKIKVLRTF